MHTHWEEFVIVLLDQPESSRDTVPLARELIRWSRTDGRTMRPRALSNDGGDIRLDPACIQPEDQAIHDLTASLRQWNKSSVQSAGAKVEDFRQRLSTRIFAHLMEVDDLWYGDLHLRPVNTPFLPTLMVTEVGDSVELSWSPLILKLYPFGNGYAVCADGTIRPLADGRLLGVS